MYDFLVNKRPPAPPAALAAAEATLAHGLPLALRELLARANGGGAPASTGLKIPDGTTAGAIGVLPVEKLADTTSRILGPGSPRVVWARDGSGNALTVDSGGHVYFWDHDTDEQVPFDCKLEDLPRYFFSIEPVKETPRSETTASPLLRHMAGGSSLEEIGVFLRDALSDETAEAFLRAAIGAGRADVVELILAAHSAPASALVEPLYGASRLGVTEAIRSLVKAGAGVDERPKAGGNTPLMATAIGGHLEAARLLVELGADPTLKLKKKRFDAERLARNMKHPNVAEFLHSLKDE